MEVLVNIVSILIVIITTLLMVFGVFFEKIKAFIIGMCIPVIWVVFLVLVLVLK